MTCDSLLTTSLLQVVNVATSFPESIPADNFFTVQSWFLFQPTKITRRSPSPSIISPSLPPRVRRVSGERFPWMEISSGKHILPA